MIIQRTVELRLRTFYPDLLASRCPPVHFSSHPPSFILLLPQTFPFPILPPHLTSTRHSQIPTQKRLIARPHFHRKHARLDDVLVREGPEVELGGEDFDGDGLGGAGAVELGVS